MVHGTVQKEADRQPSSKLSHLLVADFRKTQLNDRMQELEVDYFQNLKYLQKVANKAYHRFATLNQHRTVKADTKLI